MATVGAMTLLFVQAGAASAADRQSVSLAFDCRVAGDGVRLTPGAEHQYAVLGQREEQTLQVCGESDGCRQLRVHKFLFDCNGAVVSWRDAARAVSRAQRLALPAGFAPAPPTGLRFSETTPVATLVAATVAVPRVTTLRFVTPAAASERREAAPSVRQSVPPPTEVVTFLSGRADRPLSALAAGSRPARRPDAEPVRWTASTIVTESQGGLASLKWLIPGAVSDAWLSLIGIAALLLSATALAARQTLSLRSAGEGPGGPRSSPADDADVAEKRAPPQTPPAPEPDEASHPAADDRTDPVAELASALRVVPPQLPQRATQQDIIQDLQMTADALKLLVRQIVDDHVPAGGLRDVLETDLGVIDARLTGAELRLALADGRFGLAQSIYEQAILDLERARTLARLEHERALQALSEAQRSPATVDEACAFLGINPRADTSMAKKVVDALRQNWHPDLARDDIDREAREDRIKQINAAWDLVRTG